MKDGIIFAIAFVFLFSILLLPFPTTFGQISEEIDLQILQEELKQIKNEIQKSNKNAGTLFWSSFFIGEILAGIAIVATVRYAKQLSFQNKTLEESFEATKVKHMVDAIQEIETKLRSPKMVKVGIAITKFEPVITPLGGKLPASDLQQFLIEVGRIWFYYEVGIFTVEYIDKIFAARILPIKYNKHVQQFLKDIRDQQGETVFRHIDLLVDMLEEYKKMIDPKSPLLSEDH